MVMSVSRPSSASHSRGWPYMTDWVRSKFFDGPPLIR